MTTTKPSDTSVKHNDACTMAFGRFSKRNDCPRCNELKSGAAPRAGWQAGYFSNKKAQEARTLAAIRSHDFAACAAKSGCCTCFDW